MAKLSSMLKSRSLLKALLIALALISSPAFASNLETAPGFETQGWGLPAPGRWFKNNLFLIDQDNTTGFQIFRTSKPDAGDMEDFCKLGIQEMMVLSGDAEKHEIKHQAKCPGLKVMNGWRMPAPRGSRSPSAAPAAATARDVWPPIIR
jgi:hypothetical protein